MATRAHILVSHVGSSVLLQTAFLKGAQETPPPLPCTSLALRRRLHLWALEQGLVPVRSSLPPACHVHHHHWQDSWNLYPRPMRDSDSRSLLERAVVAILCPQRQQCIAQLQVPGLGEEEEGPEGFWAALPQAEA